MGSILKRSFDMAASSVGLVMSAPVILSLAFLSAAMTRSKPIFTQQRVGLNGDIFKIYKIKTMFDGVADESGRIHNDEERTPWWGRILRKSRLDELPQLYNVLRGDLSVVGPRPRPVYEDMAFDSERIRVRPGLTGLPQLLGKNSLSDEEALKLDKEYIREQSFLGDLKIILKTPLSLVTQWHTPHCRVASKSDPELRLH